MRKGIEMDIRQTFEFDRILIEQDDRGEWWGLALRNDDEEWERTAIARSLRGLLDGDHMRCFERFHASGEDRDVIEEWRKRAGDPID